MIETRNLKYKIENKVYNNKQNYDEKNSNITEEKIILNDVNVHIDKGEFVAILGHNGSGKTTLAKHFNALLLPTSGIVLINGEDTGVVEKLWKIRKQCGMVFQNPDNQIVGGTVEEDVAFGPENLGLDVEDIKRRVDESLERTEMVRFKNKSPNHLSGGQKQRVAIASSLAMKPDCIILDEATSMLDPMGRKEVMDVITKLNKEDNMTIILITHHMEEVARAERIIVMEEGQVIVDGKTKEVFKDIAETGKFRLEMPQVMKLAYELWKKGKLSRYDVLDENEFIDLYIKENKMVSNKIFNDERNDKSRFENDGDENSDNEILGLKNISYIYERGTSMEVHAVENVDISIKRNEFIAIIGKTGSGKSTLLQLMNGLLKPHDGKVFYNGIEIKNSGRKPKKNNTIEKYSISNLRFNVGLVFQYPESQLFEETVIKDVMFGPLNKGMSQEEALKKAKETLNLLGVNEELYERSPFELSGGEMRMIAIAGVIAMEPEIIILDEPVAGLDPVNKKHLLEILKYLQKEKNKTIIIVSHNMDDVAEYTKRVIVLNEGKVISDDSVMNFFMENEKIMTFGLSIPQVTRIVKKIKNKTVLTVEEAVMSLSEI